MNMSAGDAVRVVPAHWLKPLRPRAIGYDFVALGHASEWLDYSPASAGTELSDVRQLRVRAWAFQSLDGSPSVWPGTEVRPGTDLGELWRAILGMAHRSRHLVVVARDVWPLVAALGLWRLVDEGALSLTSPRSRAAAANRAIYVTYGPPTIITVWLAKSRDRITWVDAANWGGPALAAGDAVAQARELSERLRSLRAECRRLGLAELELSASSIGWRLWREQHLTPKQMFVHQDALALELERACYYSGRCECYGTGTPRGPVTCVDVVNAYGALAGYFAVPIRLRATSADPGHHSIPTGDVALTAIAECVIDTRVPAVPYRTEHGIIYPVGRFRATLAGPELALALRLGIVTRIDRWARYELAPVLKTWAAELLSALASARARGDDAVASALKLSINAGLGRIGARWRRWLPGGECPPGWRWGQWLARGPGGELLTWHRALAGQTYHLDERESAPDSVVAIPAWIASHQRVALWQLLQGVGARHVYYCDTDSVWVDETGLDALEDGCEWSATEPGALSIEGRYQRVQFHGPKVYCADGEWTLPGADIRPGGDLMAGELVPRQLGLADSLHRLEPPQGLARVRRVRVRGTPVRRARGAWRWNRPIRLDVPEGPGRM